MLFQTVPFGVLCFLSSYKALEKFTSRWKVLCYFHADYFIQIFNYFHDSYNFYACSVVTAMKSLWFQSFLN